MPIYLPIVCKRNMANSFVFGETPKNGGGKIRLTAPSLTALSMA